MIQFFKNMFSSSTSSIDYAELVKSGAQIIDVRSPGEFKLGHARGAINIPLDVLKMNFAKINKKKPVITCCASGMRSGSAKSILQAAGYEEVHNAGAWQNLESALK
jgi:rhodanese-related sulfurtransferase